MSNGKPPFARAIVPGFAMYEIYDDPGPCRVYDLRCEEHGTVHGFEAEALRAGIEALIEAREGMGKKKVPIADLRELLNKIDAADSLAWSEHEAARKKQEEPG
jgi:hypothetical protein